MFKNQPRLPTTHVVGKQSLVIVGARTTVSRPSQDGLVKSLLIVIDPDWLRPLYDSSEQSCDRRETVLRLPKTDADF